jgi:hypothetical protein
MSARLAGRKWRLAVVVGVVVAVVMGATAYAAIPDADGNFYACVTNSSGTIRLIEKSTSCRASERRVSWPAGQAELKIYRVTGFTGTSQQGPLVHSTASCDDGDPVTGGGFGLDGGPFNIDDLAVLASEPGHFQDHDEWKATAMMDNPDLRLHAFARCLDLPPAHN